MTVPVVRLLVYLGVGEHVLLLILARIALHQGERASLKGEGQQHCRGLIGQDSSWSACCFCSASGICRKMELVLFTCTSEKFLWAGHGLRQRSWCCHRRGWESDPLFQNLSLGFLGFFVKPFQPKKSGF